jgi:hypothetical protein
MFNFIYDIIFTIASLFILIKAIAYAIYEIKNENNKSGGISVITFSILVTAFVNFIIFTK